MLILERNSKHFLCPMAFKTQRISDTACMGDECMAWRWVNEDEQEVGFCGLSGVPVEIARSLT